jgi:hypothetical protein
MEHRRSSSTSSILSAQSYGMPVTPSSCDLSPAVSLQPPIPAPVKMSSNNTFVHKLYKYAFRPSLLCFHTLFPPFILTQHSSAWLSMFNTNIWLPGTIRALHLSSVTSWNSLVMYFPSTLNTTTSRRLFVSWICRAISDLWSLFQTTQCSKQKIYFFFYFFIFLSHL